MASGLQAADAFMAIFGMKRTPLRRNRAPIKRTPAKKRRSGPPRRGPTGIPADEWRNPEYRAFLRKQGICSACIPWVNATRGSCDPAHTEHGGTSQKGRDSSCAPLCRVHHDIYDGQAPLPNRADGAPRQRNHAAFEEFYGVDMKAAAALWWKTFRDWRA